MEVPQLGCIVQNCFDSICDVNKKLELELELVAREHGRDLGLKKRREEAKELGDSKPRPRRLAFIGRTGVGKSTAINAILGAPVLSTRADVSGCSQSCQPPGIELIWTDSDRAVKTEVFYEALPPSAWRARIKFIKKDEWEYTLSNMLDDLEAHMDGISSDSGPAMDAWETLKEESVSSLRPYLTSYTKIVEGETPESSVWHLVDSVRIYGAFDVLASHAVTLVDVPGFGDANKTRTKRTEEYIKSAEVVVLVADIKRAADDQVMHDYFAKFLQQRIRIDGSMESLLIVLTGADVRINEGQLHYLDSKQRHVIQGMCQAIDRLNKSLDELEISSADEKTIAPHDTASFKEFAERQQRMNQLTRQLKIQETAKNTYVAHQRSARVREAFLQLYRQVYFSISKQGAACEPPPLPVFCVGSTDFSQLLDTDKRRRAPIVFADPKDTGIPLLTQHIHDLGRRNVFSDIDALVDPKLTAYEDEARGLVERLKDTVYKTRLTSDDKIEKSMDKLEQVLNIEAKNAAEHSPNVIEELGMSCRYQTYRAIMKRAGEWQSIDLNENLVDGMLDGTVSSVWHDFFEDFLKSELESLIMVIRASC
ncbi:hypothetical protein EDD22DRAFT_1002569 [Suillus occidentalis]|nr:hypothetical protein EDD22DRAFT_1002569 [Suillus occidentalis]